MLRIEDVIFDYRLLVDELPPARKTSETEINGLTWDPHSFRNNKWYVYKWDKIVYTVTKLSSINTIKYRMGRYKIYNCLDQTRYYEIRLVTNDSKLDVGNNFCESTIGEDLTDMPRHWGPYFAMFS